MRVIVVGGGAAGLAAAYTLRRRGIDVTLFEAGPAAGGRMAGVEIDGFNIDTGAQTFSSTYTATMRLCDELGVRLERFSPTIGLYGKGKFHALRSNHSIRDVCRNLWTLAGVLSPRGGWQAVRLARVLRRHAGSLSFSDHARMLRLDTRESIAEVVERNGGREILEELVQNNITALTLGHPEAVGAAFGMALLWVFLWDTSAELLVPCGGVGALAAALGRACEADIRVSTPVRRVVIEGGKATGVLTREGFVAAQAVICATTATAALQIIPDLPAGMARALRQVRYSSGCHVVMGMDGPVYERDWFGVYLPRSSGSLVVNCNDGARKASGMAPRGKGCASAFLYDAGGEAGNPLALSDGEIVVRLRQDLSRHGMPLPAEPLFSRVYRWPEAVCLAPGGMLRAVDAGQRSMRTDCRGLFLAGEYTRLPSVNGAVASGVDAAEAAWGFVRGGG